MTAVQPPPSPQAYYHRPRFDGGGVWRPRFTGRFPPPSHGVRFRPQGYAGQINENRGPRQWGPDSRPGYTPNTNYNQGRQAKKSAHRKTIDYNATVLKTLQNRMFLKDSDEAHAIMPDSVYINELTTPSDMRHNPINCVTTKFVRQSTNKIRCPIFCLAWTPEGRRLITGASSGEFTLWNGLTFNFETILQAHDSSVRAMIWSHDGNWMMTGDHSGFVKYWQSNMNNVKMFQAHKDAIRGLSFCPTDNKFASGSDDGSVRIFDFTTCMEERTLKGHGADVKCVDWHPQKSILISGSKDSQQPIKLWDARSGSSLATIHAHKSTVMSMKWNKNGNWFLTASRDHLLKLFDIRNMKSEFQTFRGHQKEATVISWHPIYEDFFASGGSDGAVKFWNVGTDKEVGSNDSAHEGFIWSMAWHPLGHILVTGSNDHSTKFWARNKPGDTMKDRYNLNLLPIEDEADDPTATSTSISSSRPAAVLPGMGLDKELMEKIKEAKSKDGIPGLDMDGKDLSTETFLQEKKGKYTFTKRIDRSFAAAWEGKGKDQAHVPFGVDYAPHSAAGVQNPPPSLLGDHPVDDRHPPTQSKSSTGGLLDLPPHSGGPQHGQYDQNHRNSWQNGPRNSVPFRAQNPDFNAGGQRPAFREIRPDFNSRGPRPHYRPLIRPPRADFNGPRHDFRPRGPLQTSFSSPRPDFRGPNSNFLGPRGQGGNLNSRDNQNSRDNPGPWNAKTNDGNSIKGSWNSARPTRNQLNQRPGPY